MISRALFLALAAAGFAVVVGLPKSATATPLPIMAPAPSAELVQQVDYYKRRWRYRNGTHVRAPFTDVDDDARDTWVAAPFARVYSGRRGTWVRAPFVNLWVPR
jgi:hypothetical protein